MDMPKLKTSGDAEWRAYYENKCRQQRKEIASLRNAVTSIQAIANDPAFESDAMGWIAQECRKVLNPTVPNEASV